MLSLTPFTPSPTAHFYPQIILSLVFWTSLLFYSYLLSPLTYLTNLLPRGAPQWLRTFLIFVESISISIRPLTLALRITVNILAGHIILSLIASKLTHFCLSLELLLSLPTILFYWLFLFLELAIAFVQSFVFCLLLTIYTADSPCPILFTLFFPLVRLLLMPKSFSFPTLISCIFALLTLKSLLLSPSHTLYSLSGLLFLDTIRYPLILLTIWVSSITVIVTTFFLKIKQPALFYVLLIISSLLITACFSSSNLVLFYILFEASVIPLLLLILGWRATPLRLQASNFLLLYIVTFSLPLLFCLFMYWNIAGELSLIVPSPIAQQQTTKIIWLSFCLLIAFLLKTPLYTLHIWLPKAHVEAPVAGSIILARLLLKLGIFGIIRLIYKMPLLLHSTKHVILPIAILGSLLRALFCLRLTDLKIIVAYLSVFHMGLIIIALLLNAKGSTRASILSILTHGLSSSCLFAIVFYLSSTFHSRNLMLIGGLKLSLPLLSLLWFIVLATNISAPPTLNFFGELALILALIDQNSFILIFLFLFLFIGGILSYSIYYAVSHNKPLFITHKDPITASIQRIMHLTPLFLVSLKIHSITSPLSWLQH